MFLLTELEGANLKQGMQEELEERLEELSNVELLTEHLGSAVGKIQQEEIGSLSGLKEARGNLAKISGFSGTYSALLERVESVIIELDDIAQELENSLERVEANPEELEEVNTRLQLIYNLQKKHAAGSIAELQEIAAQLREKVDLTENAEANLKELQKEIKEKKESLSKIAGKLHENRAAIVSKFTEQVEKIISDLGMPNGRLKIELKLQEEFYNNGQDQLNWYLSANKGGDFTDIKKAASGGELSRIMLAVKVFLQRKAIFPL